MEKVRSFAELRPDEQEDFKAAVEKFGDRLDNFEVSCLESWDPSGVVQVITRSVTVTRKKPYARSVVYDGGQWIVHFERSMADGNFD